jgi:hypothetical protein
VAVRKRLVLGGAGLALACLVGVLAFRGGQPPGTKPPLAKLAGLLAAIPVDTQLLIRLEPAALRFGQDERTLLEWARASAGRQPEVARLFSVCGDDFLDGVTEAIVTFGPGAKPVTVLRGRLDTAHLGGCLSRYGAASGSEESWEGIRLIPADQGRRFAVLPQTLIYGDVDRLKAHLRLLNAPPGPSPAGGSLVSHPELAAHRDRTFSAPLVLVLLPGADFRSTALGGLFQPVAHMKSVVAEVNLTDDLIRVSATGIGADPAFTNTLAKLFLPKDERPAALASVAAPSSAGVRVGVENETIRVEAAIAQQTVAQFYRTALAKRARRSVR